MKNILTKVPLKLHKYIQFRLLCYTATEHKNEEERKGKRKIKPAHNKPQKDRHP